MNDEHDTHDTLAELHMFTQKPDLRLQAGEIT